MISIKYTVICTIFALGITATNGDLRLGMIGVGLITALYTIAQTIEELKDELTKRREP